MTNDIRNIKLQSALGALREVDNRRDMDMFGVMMVGKVTRVHHKSGTADVIVVDTNDTFKSSPNNEGRFSARILQRSAGYNDVTKKPYGTIDPVTEGSLVLLSFLNGIKQRPVILGSFPRISNPENVYPVEYPLLENLNGINAREALKQLTVFPAGTFTKNDGEGNIEKTFVGKSFFVNFSGETDFEGQINDTHGGYSYDDLTEKDKDTGETVAPAEGQPGTENGKFLFSHRTVIDGVETFIKVYLSDTGELRISRDNNDGKLATIELSAEGDIALTKQKDSPRVGMASDISEVRITSEGDVKMKNGESVFELGHDLFVRVPGKIRMFESNDEYKGGGS